MSLALTLRPGAEADLDDAYAWYEAALPGLGEAFLQSVSASLARIQRDPEAYPISHLRVRRAPVRRFPFGIFYVVRGERIDIIAVYHARRRPRPFQP